MIDSKIELNSFGKFRLYGSASLESNQFVALKVNSYKLFSAVLQTSEIIVAT